MIQTFEQRIQISGIYINGDVKRFNLSLDSNTTHYFMLALSLIISLLVNIGRLVEAHNLVMQSAVIIEIYFILKIYNLIIKSFLGGKLC